MTPEGDSAMAALLDSGLRSKLVDNNGNHWPTAEQLKHTLGYGQPQFDDIVGDWGSVVIPKQQLCPAYVACVHQLFGRKLSNLITNPLFLWVMSLGLKKNLREKSLAATRGG